MADKEIKKDDEMDVSVEKDTEEKAEKKPVKKKVSKKKDTDEVLVKNVIDTSPQLKEAAGKTVVFGWGRMNPITVGHEKLVDKLKSVAKAERGTPVLFLTHSQDAKKNPLSYDDKVMLAQKAFGNIVQKSKSKTIIQAMKELDSKYDNLVLVVGQDRVSEFETLLNKYNGKEYTFDTIKVVSAGDRDPDADDVTGMSASKLRALASEGKREEFKKGLPKKLKSIGDAVYDMVRGGMKLAEMVEETEQLEEALTLQQRRQRAITMRRYKAKIAQGRKKAMRKTATADVIQKRAKRAAIKMIRKKVAGDKGKSYEDLSVGEKMIIDKKVAKRKAAIERIAKRLTHQIRKQDRAKLSKVKEEFSLDEQFESMLESYEKTPTKRFHQARNKDGSIKLDRRFKIYRNKQDVMDVLDEADAVDRLRDVHQDEKEDLKREQEREMKRAKVRALRGEIRKTRSEEVEVESDAELLDLIQSISEEISQSVELSEEKIERSLQEKAESHGVDFSELKAIYEEALLEEPRGDLTQEQHAFAAVNVHLANLEEKTTMQSIKGILAKTTSRKKYAYAKDLLQKIVDRKRKEGNGKLKHNITWYAATVADQIPGVDARTLADMMESWGPGKLPHEMSDDELRDHMKANKGRKGPGAATWRKKVNDEAKKRGIKEEVELVEFMKFDAKDAIQDFKGKGKVAKIASAQTITAKVMPVRGNSFNTDDGYVPVLKNFSRKGKTAKVDLKAGQEVAIDTAQGNVYGMVGDKFFYTSTGNVDLKEGAGEEGTDELVKKYKDDTPGEDINEQFNALFEEVTQKQIKDLEVFADRLLDKFGVDVEFTRHFADRMNDERNSPAITVAELQRLFKKIAKNKAKDIKANTDSEAVLKDIQADLNLPVVIKFNRNKGEIEVVNKTIMRKKDFKTSNKVIKY